MFEKLHNVQNICYFLLVIRLYYTFTVNNIDDIHLRDTPCNIAESYISNSTSHVIPPSSNTSIIYPIISCGIPYISMSIFNRISPFQITHSSRLFTILPKLYSFEVSLFIQSCFVRICTLLTIFDIDRCKLLYCSSMITLAICTHNVTCYSLLLNLLIVFVWFILESRRFCVSAKYTVIRNIICGAFVTFGCWIHIMFLLYCYPYIIFVFIDNAILWKTRSKENAKQSVIRTSLNLSLWSTFFAVSIFIVSIMCIVTDTKYFNEARIIPTDQMDAWLNIVAYNDDDSLHTHLLFNVPYLYSFLFFYLLYFMYRYRIRGLQIALFYSKEVALLMNTMKDKEMNKKIKPPLFILVFFYALMLNLFSTICILSLSSYQAKELLIPLFFPLVILCSAVFKPLSYIKESNDNNPENDSSKLKKFIAAVGKDTKGNQMKAQNKIDICLTALWFIWNIITAAKL